MSYTHSKCMCVIHRSTYITNRGLKLNILFFFDGIGRSVGRSSVGRSWVGRSVGRSSVGRSLGRSSVGRSVGRRYEKSIQISVVNQK